MSNTKDDMIARLRKDILQLQGLADKHEKQEAAFSLGPLDNAFPNRVFPLSAVHEFICKDIQSEAATAGFIAGLLSTITKSNGVILWISNRRSIYPPALNSFGIEPSHIIFIDLKSEQQVAWCIEEALKSNCLAAVVGEIAEISFTSSRRLQLAVEQSKVTGLLIRRNPKNLVTASVSRWAINSISSELPGNMPGVGFPRWEVELLKIRNGKPGSWNMEWKAGEFHYPVQQEFMQEEHHAQSA